MAKLDKELIDLLANQEEALENIVHGVVRLAMTLNQTQTELVELVTNAWRDELMKPPIAERSKHLFKKAGV
jgi:uncharacterized coiled-coil protein SlyX